MKPCAIGAVRTGALTTAVTGFAGPATATTSLTAADLAAETGLRHRDDRPEDGADEQVAVGDFEKAWGMYGHRLVVAIE